MYMCMLWSVVWGWAFVIVVIHSILIHNINTQYIYIIDTSMVVECRARVVTQHKN